MRRLLSYLFGYQPYPMVGGPYMDQIIHHLLRNEVVFFTRENVLIMCQDLGYKELMTLLLGHMWSELQTPA